MQVDNFGKGLRKASNLTNSVVSEGYDPTEATPYACLCRLQVRTRGPVSFSSS